MYSTAQQIALRTLLALLLLILHDVMPMQLQQRCGHWRGCDKQLQ